MRSKRSSTSRPGRGHPSPHLSSVAAMTRGHTDAVSNPVLAAVIVCSSNPLVAAITSGHQHKYGKHIFASSLDQRSVYQLRTISQSLGRCHKSMGQSVVSQQKQRKTATTNHNNNDKQQKQQQQQQCFRHPRYQKSTATRPPTASSVGRWLAAFGYRCLGNIISLQ